MYWYENKNSLVLEPTSRLIPEIYEVDTNKRTVSVRLNGLDIVTDGVDSYLVQILDSMEIFYETKFTLTQELHCKLWDNAICLQNLNVSNIKERWDRTKARIEVAYLSIINRHQLKHIPVVWGMKNTQ